MLKPKILLIITIFSIYSSCREKESSKDILGEIKLGVTESSDCLNKPAKTTKIGDFLLLLGDNFVKINHFSVQSHCAAELDFELVSTDDNKIILIEVDNAEILANCLCSYNLSTTIENLIIGQTYKIEVWDEEMDELLYSAWITL